MKYTTLKTLTVVLLINVFIFNNAWSHNVSTKASAFIISPQDHSQLNSPFLVRFGIKHFKITPAGENIHKAGHYHLLIDQTGQLSMDKPIPSDNNHLDFRLGETQVLLTLPPGKHTLQLVVGDEQHEPFEELVSSPITIHVLSNTTLKNNAFTNTALKNNVLTSKVLSAKTLSTKKQ